MGAGTVHVNDPDCHALLWMSTGSPLNKGEQVLIHTDSVRALNHMGHEIYRSLHSVRNSSLSEFQSQVRSLGRVTVPLYISSLILAEELATTTCYLLQP